MVNCVRHADCWAFNYINNGTCELLPALGECEEARTETGSTFAHLSVYNKERPRELIPRNWTMYECLIWLPHNKDSPCPPVTLLSTSYNYCLSLAPFYNLYMPGWFHSPNGFRFVTEVQTTKKCPDGYVVQVDPRCTATWQDYTVGDPIPLNAVQVSEWRDGTPLYAVEYEKGSGGYYIGYYLPTVQTVYIMAGSVISPTDVRMLVIN